MDNKKEKIDNLLRLVSENPELPIIPLVDSDIACCDYGWWAGEWGDARIDETFSDDEHFYTRSNSEDDLVEKLIDNEQIFGWESMTDEELEHEAKKRVANYNWTKCIIVYITT